jgi:nucleotide-binding universal stress UspA family protein
MKVLLGIGGTPGSFDALDDAIDRVCECGDDLTVAIVDREDAETTPDEIEARVREVLDDADLTAAVRQLEGHAGSKLVELAESEGFDRLVLAGGRRSPLGKIKLGEMVEFVLLNAETTVTLVR